GHRLACSTTLSKCAWHSRVWLRNLRRVHRSEHLCRRRLYPSCNSSRLAVITPPRWKPLSKAVKAARSERSYASSAPTSDSICWARSPLTEVDRRAASTLALRIVSALKLTVTFCFLFVTSWATALAP